MKFRSLLVAAAVVSLAAIVSRGIADEAKDATKDAKCPVSGKAINKDAALDFAGGKVYFCCENCPKAFSADNKKFATKAHHQMVQTGQLKQVACPLTAKPTKDGTEVEVSGVKVAFCCNNCKGAVTKLAAAEQLEKCFADISKGYKPAKEAEKK